MKGDGEGLWGACMTQGHRPLEASSLFPRYGLMLEGFGDFLPPPTRRTDVGRSPVPRTQDTQLPAVPHLQTCHTVTNHRVESSWVLGSSLFCISVS